MDLFQLLFCAFCASHSFSFFFSLYPLSPLVSVSFSFLPSPGLECIDFISILLVVSLEI